jgi:hypothetical protein
MPVSESGAYYEAQVFKNYLEGLSEQELRKTAYEMFVELQNARAINNFLRVECNNLSAQNVRLIRELTGSGNKFVVNYVGIEELG